jgi:hypothetical protein
MGKSIPISRAFHIPTEYSTRDPENASNSPVTIPVMVYEERPTYISITEQEGSPYKNRKSPSNLLSG